jgi:hypothetical protein
MAIFKAVCLTINDTGVGNHRSPTKLSPSGRVLFHGAIWYVDTATPRPIGAILTEQTSDVLFTPCFCDEDEVASLLTIRADS